MSEAQIVSELLAQLGNGSVIADFYEAYRSAVEKTRETGKKTDVALHIVFTPGAMGDENVIALKAAVSLKVPPVERGTTIMFATDDAQVLSRRDPRQADLFGLRTVDGQGIPAATRIAVGDRMEGTGNS